MMNIRWCYLSGIMCGGFIMAPGLCFARANIAASDAVTVAVQGVGTVVFDGLETDNPQVFVQWAQEHLNLYRNEHDKYKEVMALYGGGLEKLLGADSREVLTLKSYLKTIYEIDIRLRSLKIRNGDLEHHYRLSPGCVWAEIDETDPFGKANYQAYCQGEEAVVKLPRIGWKQLKTLLCQAEYLELRYDYLITGGPTGVIVEDVS